jgi:hypothetical protein
MMLYITERVLTTMINRKSLLGGRSWDERGFSVDFYAFSPHLLATTESRRYHKFTIIFPLLETMVAR